MARRYGGTSPTAAEAEAGSTPAGSRGALVVSSVATLVGAGGAVVSLTTLDQTSRQGPGPGLVPAVVFSALALCGVACVLRECLLARTAVPAEEADRADGASTEGAGPSVSWSRPLVAAGVLVLYVLAIPWLGFLGATFAFSAGTLTVLGHRWWRALIEAASVAVVAWALFVWLLGLPLPDWVRV